MAFLHVHKSKKFSNIERAFNYKMLHNFTTVHLMFVEIASKDAQDLKEKKVGKSVA